VLAWCTAVVIAALGLLPIARWIPGGHQFARYDTIAGVWLSGGGVVLGVAVVLAILAGKLPWLWRDRLLDTPALWIAGRPHLSVTILVVSAAALYAWIAVSVLGGRPLLIDEIVQAAHARILASGRLSAPADGYPEFFSSLHMLDGGGRVFSHFPVGGPAMQALGELIGASWIVGPLCGALAVAAFSWMLGAVEPRAGVRMGAALLFAFAPFTAFMAGSHMNHVPTLLWLVVAIAALAHTVAAERPRPALAFLCGLGYGLAATIRPGDALAFALPGGIWLLSLALRDRRRVADLLASGIGVALPIAALLWVNSQTTGSPLLFGYEALWGKNFALGFGATSIGVVHTPLNGIELLNQYFVRLGANLFESPLPGILPVLVTLVLTRHWAPFDRYLWASSALLLGTYAAYWHDGLYLGPRLLYPLIPVIALWSARALPALRASLGKGMAYRVVVFGALTAAVMGATTLLPMRVREYATMLPSTRWDPDAAAEAAGVRNAVVFVRDSWGAQLVARLWVLGISRPDTERLYYRVDACVLENAVTAMEHSGDRGRAALARLMPLMADSTRLVAASFTPDSSIRALPGSRYDATCTERVNDDRAGFTPYPPMLLARSGNVFARDLHQRNRVILDRYPDRPVFLLRATGDSTGYVPEFLPLSRDSLEAAWPSVVDDPPLTTSGEPSLPDRAEGWPGRGNRAP
jgi:hypothetical protein